MTSARKPVTSAVESRDTPAAAPGFGGAVARLSGASGLLVLMSIVTGPVLARALGPEGRGELSAILAIFAFAPLVLDFGLGDFVARERAVGTRPAAVTTAMLLAMGFSVIGIALAIPVAELVGQGRPVVEQFVRIGLLASPLLVLGWMLIALARGAQRWPIIYRWRIINALGGGILIIGLALFGLLTVESAVIATMGASLAGLAGALPVLSGIGRLRFNRAFVRPALKFGARSWIIMLSAASNFRLDQVVMAAVVPSEELGHYAVAVSVTGIAFVFVGSVNTALLPRVAQEGANVVPYIARMSVLALSVFLGAMALSAPVLVPLIFGEDFREAVVLLEILALGMLFFGLSAVLSGALQGHGRPQAVARPQVLGLAITLVGLAVVLGPLGALGAALVSVVAYAVVLIGVLRASVREFEVPLRSLVVPRWEDVRRLATTSLRRRGRT